jgi:uncharacterized protein YfaP (DUF2135 family)
VPGDVTVTLTWGSQPQNLDSHLSGPTTETGRFHLSFANQASPPVTYASLDLNDQDGFGPETITIRRDPATGQFVAGEYRYWVHNFSHASNSGGSFAASDAHVVVSQGTGLLASFDVSDATGPPSRDVWFVVEITIDSAGTVTLTTVQQIQTGTASTVL